MPFTDAVKRRDGFYNFRTVPKDKNKDKNKDKMKTNQ